MKKFYLFALSLGVAASTFAAAPVKQASMVKQQIPKTVQLNNVREADAPGASMVAPFKTIEDFIGEYDWESEHLATYKPNAIEILPNEELAAKNQLPLTIYLPPVNFTSTLVATVDIEKGTFTIANKQKIGTVQDIDVYFYLKDVDPTTGEPVAGASAVESVVGTIDGALITFPENILFVIGNHEHEELGAWVVAKNNRFIAPTIPEGDPNEGWTSLGNATFEDGWLSPRFGIDQTNPENWYEVELQQNNANPNVYRLVEPYKGISPMAQYNNCTTPGYIQFDVTDPDNVLFDTVESGFGNYGLLGMSKLYCINYARWAVNGLGIDPSDLAQNPEFSYTTFKDGVVFLPFYDTGGGWFESDARMGYQGDSAAGTGWIDENYMPRNMEARIIFPGHDGVEGIDTDSMDNDAPAEYYNLQGIRVTNPAKGELVIMRKGNKTVKMIVK